MIIDVRTYTHKPSKYREFLKIYAETGYPITAKFLGVNIGLFTASSETANQTIQFFAYEDHDDRDRCRNNYLTSAAKQAFTNGDEGADGCIRIQHSTVIVPTSFSPLKDRNLDNPILKAPCGKRIIEHNTYTVKPGCMKKALDVIEKKLYPAAQKKVPWTLGYFTTDTAEPAIWELRAYETRQQRMLTNAALMEDAEYYAAYEELCQYLIGTNSKLMEAMPMSPIQ